MSSHWYFLYCIISSTWFMMLLESTNMLLDANIRVFTNNKRTLSLESWSTTSFPSKFPCGKSQVSMSFFGGRMVWFSTFYRKNSCIATFSVDTSTPSCEDWKDSERIHTQRWIQNTDVLLHPDWNFKVEDSK